MSGNQSGGCGYNTNSNFPTALHKINIFPELLKTTVLDVKEWIRRAFIQGDTRETEGFETARTPRVVRVDR